jgi:predicted AAA+ superfamily ATPase
LLFCQEKTKNEDVINMADTMSQSEITHDLNPFVNAFSKANGKREVFRVFSIVYYPKIMLIQRVIERDITKRLQDYTKAIIVYGARQVGKTTLCKKNTHPG